MVLLLMLSLLLCCQCSVLPLLYAVSALVLSLLCAVIALRCHCSMLSVPSMLLCRQSSVLSVPSQMSDCCHKCLTFSVY